MTRLAGSKVVGHSRSFADERFAGAFLVVKRKAEQLVRNAKKALSKRRTNRAISELDDWQLRDIGYPDQYHR